MVRFILRSGRKSDRDTMVFLDARDEVLTFQEWLFIGKHYFNSEDDYFPVSEGNLGKAMLFAAMHAVALGVPLETVCRRFRLPFKSLEVVDQRMRKPKVEAKEVQYLHEMM